MTGATAYDLRTLLRPSAAALEPYDPAFSPARINLSANENTFGLPEGVRSRVAEALAGAVTNRYPKPLSDELRAEIAAWHGVAPERVIVGNGGDELLFNLFLALGGRGRRLVTCPPTFTVYKLYAELVETEVVEVARDPETFEVDVDALADAASTATLTIACSPNNPTGTLFSPADVRRICEATPGIVLVDEAYIEFAREGASAEPLLDECPNLAVLRTFSKAFGLAGARVGYLIGPEELASALAAVRQPYSVNVFSQAAALEVCRARDEFVETIEKIRAERERLATALAGLPGVRVWPSDANFLLVRLPGAQKVRERLRDEHSILVRDLSAAPDTRDCLRISVGTKEENDIVIEAMSILIREGDAR